jgi:hypothetical protein
MKLLSSETNARIDGARNFCEKQLINFLNDSAILYGKQFLSSGHLKMGKAKIRHESVYQNEFAHVQA